MNRKRCSVHSSWGRVFFLSAIVGVASLGALSDDTHGQLFTPPTGGWGYTYAGDSASSVDGAALDGTWDFDNGSSEWDGTGPGSGIPGGAGVFTDSGATYLRVQDTGDPRDHGLASGGAGDEDPSNRKTYFTHDLSDIATSSVLDDGVTLSFRMRISTGGTLDDVFPDGGDPSSPWPAGGDGGTINSEGKGMVGIRQGNGGMISFDLALPSDTPETGPNGGLVMNQLNGTSITGNVDNGDGGTPNFEALSDPTAFHEFWVAISAVQGDGTHRVRLWMDGDEDNKSIFDVTAGSADEDPFDTFLSLGRPSTGEVAALDLDFLSVKPGIFIPGGAVDGDVDGDGDVTLDADFEPIRANFLQLVQTREDGDLNYNGIVDYGDFGQFKTAYLAGGGDASDIDWGGVPEPSAATLLILLASLGALRRTCRRS